jgi:Condensation domain/Phosphopantetheine attachment site
MTAFDDRYRRLSAARRELLDQWLAAEPQETTSGQVPYAPPSTGPERVLAEAWQEALDLPRVGIDDDYFTLGGDSILAVVVVARAEAAGLIISTQELFDARTVRRLAKLAEPIAEPSAERPAVLPQRPCSPERLTSMQEGILFHTVTADRPVYLVQVTCELHGPLDTAAFYRAWQAVVDQHAALRSVFLWSGDDAPRRSVADTATVTLACEDWRDVPEHARDAQLARWLAADAAAGFDLTAAPLLRLALARTAADRYRFVLTHHHLLLDGWSQQLVIADVLAAYVQLCAGRPPRLPARPSAIEDPDPPTEADQRAFWRDYLAGYTTPVELAPPVPARPAGPAHTAVTLPERASVQLRAYCRRHGVTLSTVIQGSWAAVLTHVTGRYDIVFGATTSGRATGRTGAAEAVGMFINTLPVRVRYRPADAPVPWLRGIQQRHSSTARYEHTPLTRVAAWADLPPGRALFDTIVVLENFPDRISAVAPVAGLRIGPAETHVDEGYPLVLEVTPGERVTLRARYDAARLSRERVEALVTALLTFLTALAGKPGARLDELSAHLVALDRQRDAALRASAIQQLRGSRRQPALSEDA